MLTALLSGNAKAVDQRPRRAGFKNMASSGYIGADRKALTTFYEALFRYADVGTFLSLRAFDDGREGSKAVFVRSAKIGDATVSDWIFSGASQAASDQRKTNFCPPICTFSGQKKADENAIANGLVLSVECDAKPEVSRRRLACILGEPTIISASGGEWVNPETGEVEPKLHLHWRLTEPTRDFAAHLLLKEARRLACSYVDADASAVPLNHPFRWPGSVHRKGAPRLARIIAQTETDIELADVLSVLRMACPGAANHVDRQRPTAGGGLCSGLTGDPLDIAAALRMIPNDDLPWGRWNRIAMATHAAGGAFEDFDSWSQKSSKYDLEATCDRWEHICRHPASQIGAGTLFYEAQRASPGWRKPSSFNLEANRAKARPGLLTSPADAAEADEQNANQKARRSRKAPGRRAGDQRPVIRLLVGELPATVSQAEAALISADCGVYQRGGLIVSVGFAPMLTADRKTVITPQIFEMGEHRLLELIMVAAAFEKWDARAHDFVPTDAPMSISRTLRERKGALLLPPLSGLINAPTMHADGTLVERPGYDHSTGLLYDPAGIVFAPVPDRPTLEQAKTALGLINELVDGFPFVGEADRSVTFAAILTAVVRKCLPTAPAFAFSAPVAGSGKSHLVDIMSVIATGRQAGVIAMGRSPEETEKRVASLLLSGNPVAIENIEDGFGNELLCQLLTQTSVRIRVLGRSDTPELQTNIMVTATGNNMTIDGDMARRTLLCRLNPQVERPELLQFAFHPVEKAKAERRTLLVAALTVLRAYHVAGKPKQSAQLGSFGDWSDLVRGAIIWLGCADPVDTMEQARAGDPKTERLRGVMVQWRNLFGLEAVSASQIVQRANERSGTILDKGMTIFAYPEFRDTLLAVAGANGSIEPGKLGRWLGRNKGWIIDAMRLEPVSIIGGIQKWALFASARPAMQGCTDRSNHCDEL